MRQRPFGGIGSSVPVIGQGTWFIERGRRASAVGALQRGLDLGMTHIDTAEMYGMGAAEEIVGEAIEGRRDEVFLVSKVLPANSSLKGTIAACEESLKRLRTDRLDCYLLHWRGKYRLDETAEAFERLKEAGKILSWGVSNFDEGDLEELRQTTGALPACNQVLYHLQERAAEHAVIPWCEAAGVAVVAYSPFGQNQFPAADSAGGRELIDIANARNACPRAVALAFLARRPSAFAIPKAVGPAHIVENAAAGDLELSDEEIARVDAAFPLGRRPQTLPML